ncbi:transcriptional regulator [Pelobium sp.]|nr:triple tyrosine motif-containing protein [Pelobium sp.]MDA9554817.1 transcriptional regulator [Pelobium sp.]
MKKLLLLSFIGLINTVVYAQIGIPQISNYSNLTYKGGTQNWDIEQDKNGLMYFANNEGLLTYNGKYWKIYPLPHKTIIRSLKIAADGKIYVGAQDEIGYFFPEKNGVLKFHSLRELIPAKERQFADLWDIVLHQNEIYFRTTSKIFLLKDGVFSVYKSKGDWVFMGEAQNQVFAQDTSKGLFKVKDGIWEPVTDNPIFKKVTVTAVLPYQGDTLLVTTNKNGLFLLKGNTVIKKNSPDDALFNKHRIYKAIQVNKDHYAFASISAGSFIVNKQGRVIQQFSYADGLQKNNIRCVFKDQNQNLWLGVDDGGIDFIAFNNAVKYIYPDSYKQTSGYATKILNNQIYIGTSNGLYYAPIDASNSDLSYSRTSFKEIPNTQGQIWNLNIINKKLLVAHEDGTYVIEDEIAKQIYHYPGTWLFEALSPYYPAKEIIAGTYNGLHHVVFENNEFKDAGAISGNNESLRFIVFDGDNNAIWASHPYRGIYRLNLDASYQKIIKTTLFSAKDGLPSSLNNCVARIKNRIIVATEKGIFEFDEAKQKFYPSKLLGPIFGETLFQYLNEDQDGNIWFVTNKKVGVVDFHRKDKNRDYSIVYFPELSDKVVAGFENIYPYNLKNVFIGSNRGIIHINYLKYLENIKPLTVNLTLVKTSGKADSTIFGGYFLKDGKISKIQDENQEITLPYENNSLHFEYASTLFEQEDNIEFSYQLKGFDKQWSVWSSKSEKDYTNLPFGTYTFLVKARNNLGNESKPVSFTFTVNPAWYQTWWFYLLCLCLLCLMVYLLIQRQKRKHEQEQEYLKKSYQLEIEHNENEIVKLQNEKLESEVNFKNKELATATMHLVQRGKLLTKIKEELLPIVKTENAENAPQEFKRILSLLNEAERADSDWEQFAVHFDHVHSNFLTKLKERIPSLSANDLKLCAYLKMNLSSKEMAQLLSVSIRAVEVSRYRLRKKLDVSSDTNLFDYLMEITAD